MEKYRLYENGNENVIIKKSDIDKFGIDYDGNQVHWNSNDCIYYGELYQYHDGHNYQHLKLQEDYSLVLEWEESDEISYYDLDEFNGRNCCCGGEHSHYEVLTLKNGDYILRYWSNYQGTLPGGELLDSEDLKLRLKELGREYEIERFNI